MPNKTAAKEWLTLAYHDLNGAKLMFQASHYTDTISYVLHQSVEKSLKSLFAFENNPIKKTHNLIELFEMLPENTISLTDEENLMLGVITTYYSEQKYPNPNYYLPDTKEIKESIDFSEKIFLRICNKLHINIERT